MVKTSASTRSFDIVFGEDFNNTLSQRKRPFVGISFLVIMIRESIETAYTKSTQDILSEGYRQGQSLTHKSTPCSQTCLLQQHSALPANEPRKQELLWASLSG